MPAAMAEEGEKEGEKACLRRGRVQSGADTVMSLTEAVFSVKYQVTLIMMDYHHDGLPS